MECSECQKMGYKGRTVISDGFIMDERLEDMILDEAKLAVIRNYLEKIGMEDLFEDAKNKVISGVTDENEVKRVC